MNKGNRELIRKFIIDTFQTGKGTVGDHDSLFGGAVLDSFGLLELIAFLEKQFDISVHPGEVSMEGFDSIDKITGFVDRKQREQ
jgi:acyl carrier protein